jgi:hypothetical protein
LEIDENAMDILVALFRKCARMGIEIPDVPLDTPERQRDAAHYLGRLIIMAREEL